MSAMTPSEILREWLRGCGNTTPFHDPPWKCPECSQAMLGAFLRSLAAHDWKWI